MKRIVSEPRPVGNRAAPFRAAHRRAGAKQLATELLTS
jgi:hypothetical protein